MERLLMAGLMRTLADPRLNDLVLEFQDVRRRLRIDDAERIRSALLTLIRTVRTVFEDQCALRALRGEGPPPGGGGCNDGDVVESLGIAEDALLRGEAALRDAVVVLFLLDRRVYAVKPHPVVKPRTDAEREAVLAPVDEFLSLLGFSTEASLVALWRRAADLGDQRTALFDAVDGLLCAVRAQCAADDVTGSTR